jgi:hypothetical protein
VVVSDIDGAEVPVLVVEKVQDIGGMEQVEEDHGVGDIADLLVLGSGKGQVDHGPGDNSRATIVEELEVKVFAETRVELDTHEEIVDERAGELAVGGVGGEEVGLDVAEEGEEVSVGVGGDQKTTPVVVDNRQLPPAKVEAAGSVDSMGDDPGQQSVDLFELKIAVETMEEVRCHATFCCDVALVIVSFPIVVAVVSFLPLVPFPVEVGDVVFHCFCCCCSFEFFSLTGCPES